MVMYGWVRIFKVVSVRKLLAKYSCLPRKMGEEFYGYLRNSGENRSDEQVSERRSTEDKFLLQEARWKYLTLTFGGHQLGGRLLVTAPLAICGISILWAGNIGNSQKII
jgi:hypothetical protein